MRGEGSRISVLLVDDHAVVREGYRRLLEGRGDIVVVGEAHDAPRPTRSSAASVHRSSSWTSPCPG